LGKQGALEARSCMEWTQTGGALFDDFGAWIRLGTGAWEAHAAWSQSTLGKTALAMAGADDGLVDARGLGDAMVPGQLFLNGVALVRNVPRMGVMRDERYATDHIRSCGGAAMLIAGLRYWPQGLAFLLDEATHDATLGPVVAAARNVAFVLREIKNARFDMNGALVASVDLPAGAKEIRNQCPQARKVKRAGREVLLCASRGKDRVVWEPLGRQSVVAVLPDDQNVDWWLGVRRGTPRKDPPELAALRVDVAKLLAQAMRGQDPMIQAAVQMLAAGRTRAH